MWLMVNVARLLAACTFIFSGMVKLIDPRGTEYKIQDYAQAFGLSAVVPGVTPLVLAVLLAIVEFVMGVYLFFAICRRRTTQLAFLFMLAFTALTLYLAIAHPVSDCGCFGDALVLTHWQTFAKNVVLLVAVTLVLLKRRLMTRLITERNQWTISLYTWAFSLVFAGNSLYGLPLIDFRPYHIGVNLREELAQRDAQMNNTETYFIMEKDGERREFTAADYPDSTWTFIDTRVEGDLESVSPIADFCIQTFDGEDVTQSVLEDTSYVFLLLSPYLEQADDGVHDRKILVEETIKGREIECAVLGAYDPKASGVGEIVAGDVFYSYDAKYSNPESKTVINPEMPAETVETVRSYAVAIFRALDCFGLSRVDFFVCEDGTVVFNEINTLPGFTAISMYPMLWGARGLEKEELVDRLIAMAAER